MNPGLSGRASRPPFSKTAFAAFGLLAVLPIAVRFYWPAGNGLDVTGYPVGRDFINNWVGPRLAFGGEMATLFDLTAYAEAIGRVFGTPLPFHNWGYPPFSLLLLWPFAQLPYFAALAAWTLLLFGAFAAVTLSQVAASERLRALLLLFLSPACLINTIGGQNGFLTGFLLVGGLLALERRPWLAGVLFGMLTYKPHLGLVLPFVLIAIGAWRTIASASLTAIALAGISAAVFGLEPWRAYFTTVSAFQFAILERFEGFFTYMMASVYAGARTFGLSSHVAFALQAAVSLPVLAATVWGARRSQDARQRTTLVVCAVPLLTPYAFNYDLTAVAAVIVWRLCAPEPDPTINRRLLAAWMVPALMMPLNMIGVGIAPLALIALYLTILQEIARPAPTEFRALTPAAA
ncbi:DUF2029 domain-containing protein [Methylobacterium sp. C25]|uniref:glycosyltransferase family 87 protein n=1 Tax=Methylobacterium sp. C25 TaxID=2721622 RepID=UPI001F203A9B|nr:glycosyltransferase family 87 protein [Methylobacterium sp. C25]MCE4224667.1 DUF2029 domain-containing protein [Methylobacterium sp. C25]